MTPRLLIAFVAALFAASAVAAPADPATPDGGRDIVVAVDNPILPPAPHAASNVVGYGGAQRYRNGQRAMSTIAELKRRHGLSEVAGWPIASLGVYCAVLRPAPGADADALLQALARDARVRIAEPLHEYDLYARPSEGVRHNDPYVGLQRGFAEIHAAAAQRVSQGRGVEVALVDTGVDVAHPDLKGRIRGTHNLVDDDAAAFSRDRHGTEVAGVIAAVGDNRQGIVGIAPKATLSVYKACWHAPGAGVAVDLVQAHMWFNIAAMRGHKDGAPMRKEIAGQMSDSEIGMAQRAAHDWLKAHPQAPVPVEMPFIRVAA